MTRLRKWQAQCVNEAIRHYQSDKHFFCQATPGAGKTIMAAELAARMREAGRVDFVLCFSPSIAVAESMRSAFSKRLKARFDAKIGAIGGSFTYQAMQHLNEEFWSLLNEHRVLVILDEIHHCAVLEYGVGNAWGQLILSRIQHHAAYTLALSGTPWRSDRLPITLACYTDKSGQIRPNYIYRFSSAISEGVCRVPQIILVDNEELQITTGETSTQSFKSIESLLAESRIGYSAVLRNHEALKYLVGTACERLQKVRQLVPDAAGLVVTSSVGHAEQVAGVLRARGESVVVVNYQTANAQGLIKRFRNSSEHWIVSIGMISEGTDIPRLQVCCHVSRIRTELYFRQILGRILRRRKIGDDKAWLYVFAEPTLSQFAQRVAEDLPEHNAVSHKMFGLALTPDGSPLESNYNNLHSAGDLVDLNIEGPQKNTVELSFDPKSREQMLSFAGQYRRKMIQIYESPF